MERDRKSPDRRTGGPNLSLPGPLRPLYRLAVIVCGWVNAPVERLHAGLRVEVQFAKFHGLGDITGVRVAGDQNARQPYRRDVTEAAAVNSRQQTWHDAAPRILRVNLCARICRHAQVGACFS